MPDNQVELVSTIQQLVQAVNNLNQTINAVLPQASDSISHSATGGADALPANPSGFLLISVAGVAYKIPLYDS